MKVYFVRHGESEGNAEGWGAYEIDAPLTIRGMEQASEVAQQISKLDISFDTIISSDKIRAVETAEIIAKKLKKEYVVYPEFSERKGGELAGIYFKDVVLHNNPLDYFKELEQVGGEGIPQLDKRAEEFMSIISEADGPVLLVGHSGFTRHLRLRYDPLWQNKAKTLLDIEPFENGKLYQFELKGGDDE